MSDTLLILLPSLPGNERPHQTEDLFAQVVRLDEQGRPAGGVESGTLKSIGHRYSPVEPGTREVVALLPGEDVLLTSVVLPAQRQRQVRQALPYLVEEDIAQDPDLTHVVLGPPLDDGSNAVAVVDRQLLKYWMDALAKEDIYPDSMWPETLFLPLVEGAVGSLVFENGRCLLRTGFFSALTLERETLFESLKICLPDIGTERKALVCWTRDEGEATGELVMNLGMQVQPIQIRQMSFEGSHLELIALEFQRQVPAMAELNLLQGDFEPAQRRSAARTLVASVVAAALVIFAAQVAFDVGRSVYLRSQASTWDQSATSLYRELFPQDRRIVNLRGQMENHLARLRESGADDDFIGLLGTAGKYAQAFPGRDFVIQRINFSEQNRSLVLDLHVGSLQTLDRYKQALAQNGLSVDIASAVSEDQVVKARLRISRAST